MKVLYVITRGDTIAGAQQNVLDLATAANDRGQAVVASSGEDGPFHQALTRRGVPFVPIESLAPGSGLGGLVQAARDIDRVISSHAPDLVHAHSSTAGFLTRLVTHLRGIPCVFTAHGWSFTSGVATRQRALGLALEASGGRLDAHVVTVSQFDRQLARRYRLVPAERLHTIECGIAVLPAPPFPASDAPPRVLMTARFEPQKDHETLLRALARLTDRPWHLTLAGDGPRRGAMRDLAGQLGIAERVTFAGFVRNVDELLAQTSLFVLSTHYEGLPISIMEAMRAGRPVVATDVDGVGEAIDDGITGELVPHGDVEALADSLGRWLGDPERLRRAGDHSRQRFEEQFTVDRMVGRMSALYDRIVDETRHG